MSAPPTVSVVMAAYNGARLLPETLRSLSAQTMADWELVVVDDCSADDTLAVLRGWPDPRVRVIASDRNGGPVAARNRAAAEATGRYLAGLDQDDLCHPDRFAAQVAWLDAHPDAAALGTAATFFEGRRERASGHAGVTSPALIEWLLRIENPLVWSSMMLRGDAARRLAPFERPERLFAEDFDLYHRISRLGRVGRLDRPLVRYRVHAGGASQRFTDTMRASATAVLEEAHRPGFGADAGAAAALLAAHVMLRAAVPDRATFAALGRVLAAAQATFLAERTLDAADRRLIRWETARRWTRAGRAGLRSGALSPADVVAVRPDHLGLGYAGVAGIAWSGAVGGARSLLRRRAA